MITKNKGIFLELFVSYFDFAIQKNVGIINKKLIILEFKDL